MGLSGAIKVLSDPHKMTIFTVLKNGYLSHQSLDTGHGKSDLTLPLQGVLTTHGAMQQLATKSKASLGVSGHRKEARTTFCPSHENGERNIQAPGSGKKGIHERGTPITLSHRAPLYSTAASI